MFLAALFLVGAVSCTSHVVRDPVVYQAELDQYDNWATKQATLLRGFVAQSCVCNAAKEFTTPECVLSADFILTIGARSAWHKAMSLYLAGITEERPPEVPPAIPPNSSLCPVAAPVAAPAPEGGQ